MNLFEDRYCTGIYLFFIYMQSSATTVEEYLATAPEAQAEYLSRMRDTINHHIPSGFQECMQYGMI